MWRGGRLHHWILARGGEAKCHREHGAGPYPAVHAAVHNFAPRVSGHDGLDCAARSQWNGRSSSASTCCWPWSSGWCSTQPPHVIHWLCQICSTACNCCSSSVRWRSTPSRSRRSQRASLNLAALLPTASRRWGKISFCSSNLAWSAWLYARFLRRRGSFASLERWQVGYLPVYSGWAALVVIVFPPLFGYR